MARPSEQFTCQSCGDTYRKWQGRCDSCGEWNSLLESTGDVAVPSGLTSGKGRSVAFTALNADISEYKRTTSQIGELDRVLGGGFRASANRRCCCRRSQKWRSRAPLVFTSRGRKRPSKSPCGRNVSALPMRRCSWPPPIPSATSSPASRRRKRRSCWLSIRSRPSLPTTCRARPAASRKSGPRRRS